MNKELKLNLTGREIEKFSAFDLTISQGQYLINDWFAMHAELERLNTKIAEQTKSHHSLYRKYCEATKLIEKLDYALQNESENTTTRKLTITELALSAVEEWRKK